MKLIIIIAFVFFHIVTCSASMSPDIFVGVRDLQIGFGENCHLFWNGNQGYRKNAEFRCDTSKGDPIWIEKRGDLYAIGSGDCPLYWNGDRGNTKNAEFRCGKPISDLFYIKARPNNRWTIGYSNCPLFWRGDSGDVKNAEFRCYERGTPDVFWIKGAGCKPTNVEILDSSDVAKFDGEELIGVVSAGSCSGGEHTLSLDQSKSLSESLALGTTKNTEINWQVSASITVKASAKFFGSGGSVASTVGFSAGGGVTWGTSRTKTTGSTSTTGSGVRISYKTPGGAIVVGFARRYKFDNARVPGKVTVTCKGGHSFKYTTEFSLKTTTYSQSFYKHYLGEFLPGQCTQNRVNCLYRWRFHDYTSVMDAHLKFNQCFPPGIGQLTKK